MSLLARLFPGLFGETEVTIAIKETGLPEGYKRSPRYGSAIFANFGDYIVCDSPEQHPVGMFVRTVKRGDDSADIKYEVAWLQHPIPEIGTRFEDISCAKCGARWCAPGMHMHFEDGWR